MATLDYQFLKSDYQSLKTEYKKHIEHHSNELHTLIREFEYMLNNFSSSPIIPPEAIEDVTSKSYSVLPRLMENNDYVKESIFIVESLDYSADIEKFNTAKKQLKNFILFFQDHLVSKYLQEIELFFSLWKEMYYIDDFWCKQHFFNGQSRFSISYIESFEHSILHGARHFCHNCLCILNKLYDYAEHQNKSFQDFRVDIS